MEKEELLRTNEKYDANKANWEFYAAAYGGTKDLIAWGVLKQFEDDATNFLARKNAAFGFNYTKRVVNIVNDFLREIPFEEELGAIGKDELWNKFTEDCDLYGTNWNNFWSRKRRWASVFGHCGILVDKASGEYETRDEEVRLGIYPYLAYYTPLNILDWQYKRNPKTNRPMLTYLKLYEAGDTVRIWTQNSWEVWQIPEKNEEEPTIIGQGVNPFARDGEPGIIPFAWFGNGQDAEDIGDSVSDVADIAMIDASMVRDASNADEVITNAAFPMLAVPKEEITEGGENTPVEIGPTRIFEFESGNPGDKPFWLESKVKDSIDAILKLWHTKSDEIYGIANLSVIKSMSNSRETRSGDAQKESFRFLNSALAEKVDSEIEARLLCIKYWAMWQGMDSEIKNVRIGHEKKFNAEKLLLTIDDAMKAKGAVESRIFGIEIDKLIAKRMLGNVSNERMSEIDGEIEANPEKVEKKEKTTSPLDDPRNW